jgi:hypothetical protein
MCTAFSRVSSFCIFYLAECLCFVFIFTDTQQVIPQLIIRFSPLQNVNIENFSTSWSDGLGK